MDLNVKSIDHPEEHTYIRKCACYRTCTDSSDFYKVVSLKEIGLHIYRYRSRCEHAKLDQEDRNKTTNISSDIIIVQNTRNVDITADQYLPELDKYKICPRCKYIFDHTQKLLEKLPQVRRLDTISICDHCITKISVPCRKCLDIVKKFTSSNIQKRLLLKEILPWLSNRKRLLDRSEKLGKLKHRSRSYTDNLAQSVIRRSARQLQIGELVDFEDLSHIDIKQGIIRFSKRPLLIEQPLESRSESILFHKDDKGEYSKDLQQQKFNNSHELLSTLSSTTTALTRIRLKFPSNKNVYDDDGEIVISTQKEVSDLDLSTFNLLLNEEKLQRPQKDFRYLFIKERKEERRSTLMSKSSTELIKEIQDRLNIEIEEEKKKDEKLKLEDIKKQTEERQKKLEEERHDKKHEERSRMPQGEEKMGRPEEGKLKNIEEINIQEQRNLREEEGEKIKPHKHKLQKIEAEGKPDPKSKKIEKDKKQTQIFKEEEINVKELEEKKKKHSEHEKKMVQAEKNRVHLEKQKDIKEALKHEKKQRTDKPLLEDMKKERKIKGKQKLSESELVKTQKIKNKQDRETMQSLEIDKKVKEREEKEIIKKEKQDKLHKEKEANLKIKEQEKTREKEEKIRQEKQMKELEEKQRSDNYLLELQKLKAEQARQKEIETKLKEEERKRQIEEAKNKAKKEAEYRLKMIKEVESQKPKKAEETEKSKKKVEEPKIKEINVNEVKIRKPSTDDLILRLVRLKQSERRKRPKRLSELNIPRRSIISHKEHRNKRSDCAICNDSDLELDIEDIFRSKMGVKQITDIIIGEKILKHKPHLEEKVEEKGTVPIFFKSTFQGDDIVNLPREIYFSSEIKDVEKKPIRILSKNVEQEVPRGVIRYALSDRSFIEKGWTMLPTEKVVRKMNVYRMRPAHPEFDWFEHNKSKKIMSYDSGEKLAEFDDNGRGRWFYRNGRLALDYYDAEELNAQQRFVIHSSGNPDERGRTRPLVILATFDYLGNGIVFDHTGKIRLKYNQTEGVVLDRNIGPVSHWKWHTLNDPPVLQQVMIDTQMAHKDPQILKLGGSGDDKPRPDNEEMLAIEFDNFIKEKSKKLSQKFKPFQIKMKALKINEHFSLKVLDQATVYLIFRDGTTNLKINIGMILDHKEIVDTDTAEVGEVSNSIERFPAKTQSLAVLQRSVAHAQRVERARVERERRLRPPEPCLSADKLTAAATRPLRIPLHCAASSTVTSRTRYCRKPSSCNLYYDARLS